MVLKTWLDVPDEHDFSVENLPFGIFSTAANVSRDTNLGSIVFRKSC